MIPLRDRLRRPLRDLRISVTDRCNLRCGYCMPAEVFGERYRFLPRPEVLRFEEIERIARIAVGLGVRKLRITGGEPLMRAELPHLVARLSAIAGVEDLALTTNGVLLARHARALREAGLQRVTVSLDSHDEETFLRMNGGRSSSGPVLEGIAEAGRVGLGPIKINCVVQRSVNEHTVVEMARRFRGTGHTVRFIEYMDVGTRNGWAMDHVVPAREILQRIEAEFALEPVEPAYPGEVARRYRYRDGSGEIGIIASVTQPFCGGCTRARLTADGRWVACLFASEGVDLKAPLRAGASDRTLEARIRGAWTRRDDRYSEVRTSETDGMPGPRDRRIEMYEIGG